MKCFEHPELDAVGTCKQCSKGLCSTCAVDLAMGISCHGECRQLVSQTLNLAKPKDAPIVLGAGFLIVSAFIYDFHGH